MKPSKLLKLHERCVDILDMMNTCECRIINFKHDLMFAESRYAFSPELDYYKYQIERHREIKARLAGYYADVMQRILKPVMDKVNPICDIEIKDGVTVIRPLDHHLQVTNKLS